MTRTLIRRAVLSAWLAALIVATVVATVRIHTYAEAHPGKPYRSPDAANSECRITPAEARQTAGSWDLAYWTGACHRR